MTTNDTDTLSAQDAPEFAPAQFVRWFREVAPYVHDFRGKTFVVAFGGELVSDGVLNALIQDLSLLSALGVKLVLVHGSRPQVNEQLKLKGYNIQFGRGTEPTRISSRPTSGHQEASPSAMPLRDGREPAMRVASTMLFGCGRRETGLPPPGPEHLRAGEQGAPELRRTDRGAFGAHPVRELER